MIHTRFFIFLLVIALPFMTSGQNEKSGIKWTTGLSWKEVQKKAKVENKYIFLDCYATWCGPCKLMDKEVYPNDSVGQFFNERFISVRVQMDQTKKDDAFIQAWYKDADEIGKHYLLEGYPSFLFFSPDGTMIHKQEGAKEVQEFIAIAQMALTPGIAHRDVYKEYEKFIADYKKGIINYDRIPEMFAVAKKLGDTVSRELLRVHENYVSNQNGKERYTKENIEFWSTLNLVSDRKIIQFFYRDGNKIDRVMNKKGYAARQVDKCIQNVIVGPFINDQLKDPVAKSGVTTITASTGIVVANPTCYDEANWEKLKIMISRNFNSYYTKRNLLKAKVLWYEKNSNWIPYAKNSLKSIKKYPPDLTNFGEVFNLNGICWNIFFRINDKNLLKKCVQYTGNYFEKLFREQQGWKISNYIDTYANLLYKIGRIKEAIKWEQKALNIDPQNKSVHLVLEQMKKGEPTYGMHHY